MKYCILLSVGLLLMGCTRQQEKTEINQPQIAFNHDESNLLDRINFDVTLMAELKRKTQSELSQLASIDAETSDISETSYNGLSVVCADEKASVIVHSLKEKFRTQGYLIFTTENNEGSKTIAVIKGSNDLEILHYRKTNGINYDLDNADILEKLTNWKEKYGLNIIGCSGSWVEIQFHRLPEDLDSFAKEVYAFCPDLVDQGVGSIENLKEYFKETRGLWLWWD